MRETIVRVPGKLMLSGEYAVLMGAPALLACTDRFAEVRIGPAGDAGSSARLSGFANARYAFTMQRKHVRWAEGTDAHAVALVTALLEQFPPAGQVALSLDSTEFYDGDRKLGLGSSAAIAVALGIALAQSGGYPDVLDGIVAAHRHFQRGKGSGADIYAVARGGITVFRDDARRPCADSARWPDGLIAQPVRCEQAADTPDRITRFSTWLTAAPEAREQMSLTVAAATQVVNSWRSATPAAIITAMNGYFERMQALDNAAQLGYLGGGHRRVLRIAGQAGVFYKPCGAGGGDYGIALATGADAMQLFRELAEAESIDVAPMSLVGNTPSISAGTAGADA